MAGDVLEVTLKADASLVIAATYGALLAFYIRPSPVVELDSDEQGAAAEHAGRRGIVYIYNWKTNQRAVRSVKFESLAHLRSLL